jgi:hypothetical protein
VTGFLQTNGSALRPSCGRCGLRPRPGDDGHRYTTCARPNVRSTRSSASAIRPLASVRALTADEVVIVTKARIILELPTGGLFAPSSGRTVPICFSEIARLKTALYGKPGVETSLEDERSLSVRTARLPVTLYDLFSQRRARGRTYSRCSPKKVLTTRPPCAGRPNPPRSARNGARDRRRPRLSLGNAGCGAARSGPSRASSAPYPAVARCHPSALVSDHRAAFTGPCGIPIPPSRRELRPDSNQPRGCVPGPAHNRRPPPCPSSCGPTSKHHDLQARPCPLLLPLDRCHLPCMSDSFVVCRPGLVLARPWPGRIKRRRRTLMHAPVGLKLSIGR